MTDILQTDAPLNPGNSGGRYRPGHRRDLGHHLTGGDLSRRAWRVVVAGSAPLRPLEWLHLLQGRSSLVPLAHRSSPAGLPLGRWRQRWCRSRCPGTSAAVHCRASSSATCRRARGERSSCDTFLNNSRWDVSRGSRRSAMRSTLRPRSASSSCRLATARPTRAPRLPSASCWVVVRIWLTGLVMCRASQTHTIPAMRRTASKGTGPMTGS
jgi:hypothetical protein